MKGPAKAGSVKHSTQELDSQGCSCLWQKNLLVDVTSFRHGMYKYLLI